MMFFQFLAVFKGGADMEAMSTLNFTFFVFANRKFYSGKGIFHYKYIINTSQCLLLYLI